MILAGVLVTLGACLVARAVVLQVEGILGMGKGGTLWALGLKATGAGCVAGGLFLGRTHVLVLVVWCFCVAGAGLVCQAATRRGGGVR